MKKQILFIIGIILILLIGGGLACTPPVPDPISDTTPSITVDLNGSAITNLSQINGGSIAPDTQLLLTFTVTNTGTAAVSLPAGSVVVATGSNFTLDADLTATIQPGEAGTFRVAFQSALAGDYSSVVTISHGANVLISFTLLVACAPDVTAPEGYGVSIDAAVINSINQSNFAFTLSAAELGTVSFYAIDDDNNAGTAAIVGSFTVTAANQNRAGIDVTSLADGTLTLTIHLEDAANNTGIDVTDTVTKETGIPGVGGGLIASNITTTTIDLDWAASSDTVTTDPALLQYKVVRSLVDNLNTVNEANSATIVQDWSANIIELTVASLTPGTSYYFNVLVRDEAGNIALYTAVNAVTENLFPLDYVVRWRFDNNANDSLGNYHLSGSYAFDNIDFKVGTHSVVFDGTNNYLQRLAFPFGQGGVGNPGLGLSSFSISSWVFIDSTATNKRTVFYWDGLGIYYDAGKFYGDLDSGAGNVVESTGDYATDSWYHVVFTFDETTDALTLYINNEADGTASSTLDRGSDVPKILNVGNQAGESLWIGKIDDIVLYDRVLSPAEVQQIYVY